jgi:DNA polymerase-1
VVERSGVRPEQIPDLIALRGDPSDGIPGAKGIGAKGAAALLAEYGTLEESLAAAGRGEVAGRAGASLVAQHDQLLMFKWIATLQLPAVEVPADSPLDLAAGASAAEADGLGKLAARIRRLAGATG